MTKAPKFYVHTVTDHAGKKPVRTRMGSAWSDAQGGGRNVDLHALPVDGRIVVMLPKDEPGGGSEGGA